MNDSDCGIDAKCVFDDRGSILGEHQWGLSEAYCKCDNGFYGNGSICVEIDECAQNSDDCHRDAYCKNIIGSYLCECDEWSLGDGKISCYTMLEKNFNGSKEYYLDEEEVESCFKAKEKCKATGGHLVAFETDEE